MRILAIYRHYWPDTTPYARILRTLLESFATAGHETTVFTAQPSYNDIQHPHQSWREQLGGVDVHRAWLLPERKQWPLVRSLNFACFLLRAVWHATCVRRYDVILANVHPPVFMGLALRIIQRLTGTPYVLHCQDIHPESAQRAGKMRHAAIYAWLRECDRRNCTRAEAVVTLGDDMVRTLADRGGSLPNTVVINNPPLDVDLAHAAEVLPAPLNTHDHDRFRVLFAGNLGNFQGLDEIIAAAHQLAARQDIQFIFMGEGLAKERLVDSAADLVERTVWFLPYQRVEAAWTAIGRCDLGLVSLLPEIYRYAFPSKSMMYFAAGCPVLAVMESESELAATIHRYGLGYVAPQGDIARLTDTIALAADQRSYWSLTERNRIAKTCQQLYGRQAMLAKWHGLLGSLGMENSRAVERPRKAA